MRLKLVVGLCLVAAAGSKRTTQAVPAVTLPYNTATSRAGEGWPGLLELHRKRRQARSKGRMNQRLGESALNALERSIEFL